MRYGNLSYILLLSIIALLGGCEKPLDESSENNDLVPLELSLVSGTVSQASKAAIDVVDLTSGTYSFGMCIHDFDNGIESSTAEMDGYNNIEATATVISAENTSWDYKFRSGPNMSAEKYEVLSIVKGKETKIYSYYPFVSGTENHGAIAFDTSLQRDWMCADPVHLTAAQTVESPVHVALTFRHIMTCIEVRLKNSYSGNITLTSLTLTDTNAADDGSGSRLYSGGTFDSSTGLVDKANSTRTKSITLNTNASVSPDGNSFYFIIPDIEEYNGGLELSFKFNGINASATYPIPLTIAGTNLSDDGFKIGYKYQYLLKVDNTMNFLPVDIDKTGAESWGDGGQFDIGL